MDNPLVPDTVSEVLLLKLARELAMEINTLDEILDKHKIDLERWDRIRGLPRFQQLLLDALTSWHAAQNAPERVKVKSAAMLEEALPEMYSRIHDTREPLAAKTEMLKLVSRLAGIGNERVEGAVSEKFTLHINIGDGGTHNISAVTSQVTKIIDHEPQKVISPWGQ